MQKLGDFLANFFFGFNLIDTSTVTKCLVGMFKS